MAKTAVLTGMIVGIFFLSACMPMNQPDPAIEQGETAQPTAIRIVETPDDTSTDPSGSAVSPSDLNDDESTQPIDPVLEEFIQDARIDLAKRQGIEIEIIELEYSEAVEWADTCLECPAEDEICTGVLTAGYLIQLSTGENIYEYHTALDWMRFCENLP